MRIECVLSLVSFATLSGGCCESLEREWEVAGSVVQADTGEPIVGAEVEVALIFTTNGPGNQVLPSAMTDQSGRFVTSTRFVAGCLPTIFGSEVSNTSTAPRWIDVRASYQGVVTHVEFAARRDPEPVVDYTTLADGQVLGRIELTPIAIADSP